MGSYLWVFSAPGVSSYPLGVYHERPPDDVGFITAYDVGDSIPARLARSLTGSANQLLKFYNDLLPIP